MARIYPCPSRNRVMEWGSSQAQIRVGRGEEKIPLGLSLLRLIQ